MPKFYSRSRTYKIIFVTPINALRLTNIFVEMTNFFYSDIQIVVFKGSEKAKVCLQGDDSILYRVYRVYKTVIKLKKMVFIRQKQSWR